MAVRPKLGKERSCIGVDHNGHSCCSCTDPSPWSWCKGIVSGNGCSGSNVIDGWCPSTDNAVDGSCWQCWNGSAITIRPYLRKSRSNVTTHGNGCALRSDGIYTRPNPNTHDIVGKGTRDRSWSRQCNSSACTCSSNGLVGSTIECIGKGIRRRGVRSCKGNVGLCTIFTDGCST